MLKNFERFAAKCSTKFERFAAKCSKFLNALPQSVQKIVVSVQTQQKINTLLAERRMHDTYTCILSSCFSSSSSLSPPPSPPYPHAFPRPPSTPCLPPLGFPLRLLFLLLLPPPSPPLHLNEARHLSSLCDHFSFFSSFSSSTASAAALEI